MFARNIKYENVSENIYENVFENVSEKGLSSCDMSVESAKTVEREGHLAILLRHADEDREPVVPWLAELRAAHFFESELRDVDEVELFGEMAGRGRGHRVHAGFRSLSYAD